MGYSGLKKDPDKRNCSSVNHMANVCDLTRMKVNQQRNPLLKVNFIVWPLKWHPNGQLTEFIEYNQGIPHGDA